MIPIVAQDGIDLLIGLIVDLVLQVNIILLPVPDAVIVLPDGGIHCMLQHYATFVLADRISLMQVQLLVLLALLGGISLPEVRLLALLALLERTSQILVQLLVRLAPPDGISLLPGELLVVFAEHPVIYGILRLMLLLPVLFARYIKCPMIG